MKTTKVWKNILFDSYILSFIHQVLTGCTSNVGECLGLLGAGTGLGSCAAPPFRSSQVEYKLGCPLEKPCCSEYGYCRTRKDWQFGFFRDCNGVSNGKELEEATVAREMRELLSGNVVGFGRPAGLMGPKIKLREQFTAVLPTDKIRPITAAPVSDQTHQNLIKENQNESNQKHKFTSLDELKTFIYLINKNYGEGAARDVGITLKLKHKLPSQNFKTKRDFLEQLKITLLKNSSIVEPSF